MPEDLPLGPIRLQPRGVAKPWGVESLPAGLAAFAAGERTGEIWFEATDPAAPGQLLVKMLFTSERLSVQVHPDDERARAIGLAHGKDEAWIVLDVEPSATIGVGIIGALPAGGLAAAAQDGSIVDLMEWRPVAPGDVLYVPGGTIHALGAGLALVEVQQALDLTYRLYDYGRPRELHLADGIAAAKVAPFGANAVPQPLGNGRDLLAAGGKFVMEILTGAAETVVPASPARPAWLVMLAGAGRIADTAATVGSVWCSDAPVAVALEAGARLLVAYPGAEPWPVAAAVAA